MGNPWDVKFVELEGGRGMGRMKKTLRWKFDEEDSSAGRAELRGSRSIICKQNQRLFKRYPNIKWREHHIVDSTHLLLHSDDACPLLLQQSCPFRFGIVELKLFIACLFERRAS